MSYLYLSAAAYFGRDNVGLPGFSAMFKHQSDEEREHALRLMEYQVRRGGRVVLGSLLPPNTEFDHEEKGDAQHAAEIALSLEKLNFGRLRELRSMADEADDADMAHFVEDYLLDEQSKDVKQAAVLVSQLQRAGKGLG
ncbi:ferritin, partial [Haematococcus lacustris]